MSVKKVEVSQEFFDEAMKHFEEKAKGPRLSMPWGDPAAKYNVCDTQALRLYDEGMDIRRSLHIKKVA